jgi:diguanylate cyclase (GGDEF)-like protein
MSGEDTGESPRRAVPARAVPIGVIAVVVLLGALYGVGSLLDWGEGLATWVLPIAAAAAAGSLMFAAWRLTDAPETNPSGSETQGVRASVVSVLRGSGPALGGAWRWFALAAACWCAGLAANAASEGVLSRSGVSLSLADLFFLAAIVALGTGFVVPVRLDRSPGIWLRYTADTYVCVAALFVLGWVTLFGGLYSLSGETAADFVIELMYPIIDAVLVCAMLPFVLGAAHRQRRSAAVAYAALLAIAVADVLTTVARLKGGAAAPGNPGDLVRFVGLSLLGAAPWVTGVDARRDDKAVSRMIGPGPVPATAAGVAAVFIAGHSLTSSHSLQPVVPVVAGTAVLVLLVRLGDLLWENDRLRRAVNAGEEHFRTLAESIDDAVVICGLDGTVQYVSAGAARTFDYRPDELLWRPLQEILHPEDLPNVEEALTRFLAQGGAPGAAAPSGGGKHSAPDRTPSGGHKSDGVLRITCRVRAADGTWLPTESTISRYGQAKGDRGGRLLITTRDLSEQAALQRQVAHLTFHDGLTGLPNRAYFEERTREVLSRLRPGGQVAVLFADLDGFTAVNDSAGHAAGDQVLAQAARRLRATVQVDDTVARWGGDEFAVLVESPADAQAVVDLAERLLRVLSAEPYRVGERGIVLTASVGVALIEDKVEDGEGHEDGGGAGGARRTRRTTPAAELIRNGDLAMARAKELGGGRVEVFAAHMHADVVRRLELGSDLQRALADEQFAVEFQPVVELRTSRVTGVEALVRWWRDGVFVPPGEFIAPAEESGLMLPLGDWILREACAEVARWRESSWDIGLSVNFTARQIAAPRFVESVAAVLGETGLPPDALTVEVKEEVLVEDAGHTVERLSALRDLGVRLAIDDFGTGYASLAYLRQLPVDVIKIDPSFVAGLGHDDTLTLLTRTIVRLGHDLGIVVVAEGIERPDQLELLREMECPRGQGFLVARPMGARRVEALVRTNRQGTPSIPLQGSMLSAG